MDVIKKEKGPPPPPKIKKIGGPYFKIVQFGGGGVLETEDPEELNRLTAAYHQSMINCDKPVIGGGFNPRSEEEIRDVYGSDEEK